MPHGYCTECDARVTVADDRCLLGHGIDPATVSTKRGRRIASVEHGEATAAVAVMERPRLPRLAQLVPTAMVPPPRVPSERVTTPPRPTSDRPASIPSRPATNQLRTPAAAPDRPVVHDDLNPTGEYVVNLWDTTESGPPLEGWLSADPLSSVPERNPVRWFSMALLGAALAALILAVSMIFGQNGSNADALSADAEVLRAAVVAFDPTSPDPDFAAMDGAARSVLSTAERLEVGDPQRAVAIDAAGRLLEAERALGEALAYQTGFVVFVGRPALPVAATEAELSDISAAYTSWVNELTGVLASTPSDRAFTEHRALVEAFESGVVERQASYLDALRAGDNATATSELQMLDDQVSELGLTLSSAVTATQLSFGAAQDEVATMLTRLTPQD